MENQKSSSSLKAVVAVLAVLLVGSLVYIFKMSSDADAVQTELKTTETEKETVMKDLEQLKPPMMRQFQKTLRCLTS
jgi:Tfp pilus assembly protein PilO